ncbi:MAG: DUF115 domain-containing protein [Kiritimatiellae bacterium]|nr:DUF115 domain-containing protein [Kiritimatiellia bacterium]
MWRTRQTDKGTLLFLEGRGEIRYWTDRTDPAGDMRREVQAMLAPDCRVAVAWLGAGHGAAAVFQHCTGLRRLYLIENDEARLQQVRECREVTAALADPRARLIQLSGQPAGSAKLREAFEADSLFFVEGKVGLFVTDRQRRLEPAVSDWVKAALLEYTRSLLSRVALRATRGWHMLANALLNLPHAAAERNLDALRGLARDRPAVVVGAGPSLDKNVAVLAERAARVTVVACDGAWTTLDRAGIVPDVVITTDDTERVWRHFAEVSAARARAVVVALLHSSWPVVRYCRGAIVFARSDLPVDRSLTGATGRPIPVLDSGLCVGHAALEVARILGATPIILIGFDLGYKGTRFHPRHAAVPSFHERPPEPANLTVVPGVDGKPIRTDLSMLMYLREFERRIRLLDRPVWDATEGGARIEGTRVVDLQTALAEAGAAKAGASVAAALQAKAGARPEHAPALAPALLQKWEAGAAALLRDVEQACAVHGARPAVGGAHPYPFLARHREMLDMLAGALNPRLHAAFQFAWEDWLKDAARDAARTGTVLSTGIAFLEDIARTARLIPGLLAVLRGPVKTDPAHLHVLAFAREPERPPLFRTIQRLCATAGATLVECAESPDDLPEVWRAFAHTGARAALAVDGALFPAAWAIPGRVCLDLRSRLPEDSLLADQWLPGYAVICGDHATAEAWRAKLPADRPVFTVAGDGVTPLPGPGTTGPDMLSLADLIESLEREVAGPTG